MDPRFYQKILQNYGLFFQKKLRYVKSKIAKQIQSFTVSFLFF